MATPVTNYGLQRSQAMKHLRYLLLLLLLALGACAQYRGMGMGSGSSGGGPGGGMTQAQHMEHMKAMQDQMARIRQTTNPTERQSLMESHMKMMDEHMARMQNMPCWRM
jgi:spore coat protein CotH